MSHKISVVIPTYNSVNTLIECIKSLEDQLLKPFEIVVVNNASTDNTRNVVKKKYPKVKLINLKENVGVSGGRNRGIKAASKHSEYIFFFDHDMIADKNMLRELVNTTSAGNNIGIVTPKIFYWGNKNVIWSAGTGINLWTGKVIFRGGKDEGQYSGDEEVQVAPAAMLVARGVIKKIKRFDERYFATFEDTDFCFRAKKAGFKVFYSTKSVAYHMLSISKKDEAKRLLDRAYWVGKYRVLFMKDFGKSMIVFLMFYPVYIVYFFYMGIRSKNIGGVINFIRGTIEGLLS